MCSNNEINSAVILGKPYTMEAESEASTSAEVKYIVCVLLSLILSRSESEGTWTTRFFHSNNHFYKSTRPSQKKGTVIKDAYGKQACKVGFTLVGIFHT